MPRCWLCALFVLDSVAVVQEKGSYCWNISLMKKSNYCWNVSLMILYSFSFRFCSLRPSITGIFHWLFCAFLFDLRSVPVVQNKDTFCWNVLLMILCAFSCRFCSRRPGERQLLSTGMSHWWREATIAVMPRCWLCALFLLDSVAVVQEKGSYYWNVSLMMKSNYCCNASLMILCSFSFRFCSRRPGERQLLL